MINNKKVFLIYIISFFLFLTLILFPNYNSKTKLFTFFVKEKIETPFIFVGKEVQDFLMVLNLNFDYMNTIKKLEGDIEVAKVDLRTFLANPIGVAEHIDYVITAEKKLEALAHAEDKLESLLQI